MKKENLTEVELDVLEHLIKCGDAGATSVSFGGYRLNNEEIEKVISEIERKSGIKVCRDAM